MADEDQGQEDEPKKGGKLPLILGLVLLLAGGGGGFYATWSGLILAPAEDAKAEIEADHVETGPDVAYVPIDPFVISIGKTSQPRHLRFSAQLEVPKTYQPDVQMLLPRIVDVINTYMRAIKITDLDAPASLTRIRGHLLRRLQVVAGEGRVNDLLIMEFVVN